jgi:hypothetical protein
VAVVSKLGRRSHSAIGVDVEIWRLAGHYGLLKREFSVFAVPGAIALWSDESRHFAVVKVIQSSAWIVRHPLGDTARPLPSLFGGLSRKFSFS